MNQLSATTAWEALRLVGIRRRGVPLAERLAKKIEEIEKVSLPVGALDISFHRDDVARAGQSPVVRPSPLPFAIEGKNVILVDDVLYTGRTARAAMDALLAFGRPRRVELCVIIDRGHRELPIQANYVGRIFTPPPKSTSWFGCAKWTTRIACCCVRRESTVKLLLSSSLKINSKCGVDETH